MMTLEQARERITDIKKNFRDDEMAHIREDEFCEDVLREVVAGNPYAKQLAALALSTSEIEFSRWCA